MSRKNAVSLYIIGTIGQIVILFLLIDFSYLLFNGRVIITEWYLPAVFFVKAILFGGIEEVGWRYCFQPMLEEKCNYVVSTFLTFIGWGIWHFLYFYVDGSLSKIDAGSFLIGLLTSCFVLSALYHKTKNLWICVFTHAMINAISQTFEGGNQVIYVISRVVIVILAVMVTYQSRKHEVSDPSL